MVVGQKLRGYFGIVFLRVKRTAVCVSVERVTFGVRRLILLLKYDLSLKN